MSEIVKTESEISLMIKWGARGPTMQDAIDAEHEPSWEEIAMAYKATVEKQDEQLTRKGNTIVRVASQRNEARAKLTAANARIAELEELLRQIRDDEVNAQDEADKLLRDHQPSELSKVRSELAAANARIAELELVLLQIKIINSPEGKTNYTVESMNTFNAAAKALKK